jgi:hypothetical protein
MILHGTYIFIKWVPCLSKLAEPGWDYPCSWIGLFPKVHLCTYIRLLHCSSRHLKSELRVGVDPGLINVLNWQWWLKENILPFIQIYLFRHHLLLSGTSNQPLWLCPWPAPKIPETHNSHKNIIFHNFNNFVLNNVLISGQTGEISCNLWSGYFCLIFRPSLLRTVSKLVNGTK